MKHSLLKAYIYLIVALMFTPQAWAYEGGQNRALLIKLKSLMGAEEFASMKGLVILDVIDKIDTLLVECPVVLSDDVKRDLLSDSRVIFVEPDYAVRIPEDELYSGAYNLAELHYFMDDPLWCSDPFTGVGQWNMRVLEMEKAWKIETGSRDVVVSVIDTGIAYDHPEISGSYLPGGRNWVHGSYDPYDDNGHGSWVSGIIAAERDNQVGIAGMAEVWVMAEKILDASGGGTVSNLAQGIIHAADAGADIINLSLGTDSYSRTLRDAVDYAHGKGCLLVSAAGNRHQTAPRYPAAFENVVAVAATYGEPDDVVSPYSNYGEWIDLSAPGGWDENGNYYPDAGEYWVVSLSSRPDAYMYGTGTSAAVPHVSGAAALYLSHFPKATSLEVTESLFNSAEDKGAPGWDPYYGHGRVNVERLLLINKVQSVGGEATLLNVEAEKPGAGVTACFIMFAATFSLMVAGLLHVASLPLIQGEKTEIYKRTSSVNRGN